MVEKKTKWTKKNDPTLVLVAAYFTWSVDIVPRIINKYTYIYECEI